jgi:hypothetical protein
MMLEAKALVSSPTYDAASLDVHPFLYSLKIYELKIYSWVFGQRIYENTIQ